MKFLDKYPNCIGCPVSKYCGTMVGSIMLCNSYELNEEAKKENIPEEEVIKEVQLHEYYEDMLADSALTEEESSVYAEP